MLVARNDRVNRRVLPRAVQELERWVGFGAGLAPSLQLLFLRAHTVRRSGGTTHSMNHPHNSRWKPAKTSRGLYVVEKKPTSFVVRELGGGTSAIAFDFRVVVPRRGHESIRLADVSAIRARLAAQIPKSRTR